ncbi:hypothetical protein KEU06_21720 [Pseudaminobacter sp. 19-2017]|uniref:Uncharacterized protein n=1 Tax=Pseudaminobacter soli (ex Zhang et al. 2022) TaxID=2831468 RepID=A0A942E5A2_9HYPH|nr:hypothetical protein [Pseudaminobacter soli]MBS3651236.1 hypothetical protein [Pseudaminobacter soli]
MTSLKGNGLQSPLKLTYLCRPEYANAPQPMIHPAATSEATRAFAGSFRLDATALNQLGLGTGADYVENVDLSFRNVRIEQLALDDLDAIRSGLGPVCTNLVREYSEKNLAYQTQQAIRADVIYRVRLKRGLSAEAKGIALKPFVLQLGGNVQEESDTTFSGEGLYHGLLLTKV